VEGAVRASGLSFAVVRPTLVFARGEILVNNIAWLLRRLPLFLVARDRAYRIQPVAAQDVADICVRLGSSDRDAVVEAAGPRVLAFEELVRHVRSAVGSRARIVPGTPRAVLAAARLLRPLAGGPLLTADELRALGADLLTSAGPPLGERRFEDWLGEAAPTLGRRLASDVRRPWS
jgi:NADH dehydrogenase